MTPGCTLTLLREGSAVLQWKPHVRRLYLVMAAARAQQALAVSFILIEGIYS